MEKKLTCRAMGLNCNFVVRDESEDALVRLIGNHLEKAHAIEMTEELRRKARDLIRLEGVA